MRPHSPVERLIASPGAQPSPPSPKPTDVSRTIGHDARPYAHEDTAQKAVGTLCLGRSGSVADMGGSVSCITGSEQVHACSSRHGLHHKAEMRSSGASASEWHQACAAQRAQRAGAARIQRRDPHAVRKWVCNVNKNESLLPNDGNIRAARAAAGSPGQENRTVDHI